MVIYAALEMRNLLEKVLYNLLLMSTEKSQWEEIEKEAKEKDGIQRSKQYKRLRFKYQAFYEAIGKVATLPVKAFDLPNAISLKEKLADYIHSYTISTEQVDFHGEYIQNGIRIIKDALKLLNNYFVQEGSNKVYGNLNLHSLNKEYLQAFEAWKISDSKDQQDIDKIIKELNKKSPIA